MSFDIMNGENVKFDRKFPIRSNHFEVEGKTCKEFVILYLSERYDDAYYFLEENFSFLFENRKQPVNVNWYHETARKIMMLVAKDPYRLRYYFLYEGDAKKKKKSK